MLSEQPVVAQPVKDGPAVQPVHDECPCFQTICCENLCGITNEPSTSSPRRRRDPDWLPHRRERRMLQADLPRTRRDLVLYDVRGVRELPRLGRLDLHVSS